MKTSKLAIAFVTFALLALIGSPEVGISYSGTATQVMEYLFNVGIMIAVFFTYKHVEKENLKGGILLKFAAIVFGIILIADIAISRVYLTDTVAKLETFNTEMIPGIINNFGSSTQGLSDQLALMSQYKDGTKETIANLNKAGKITKCETVNGSLLRVNVKLLLNNKDVIFTNSNYKLVCYGDKQVIHVDLWTEYTKGNWQVLKINYNLQNESDIKDSENE